MIRFSLLTLLFFQASNEDIRARASNIDGAVKGIAGYNVKGEHRPVADDVFLKRVMKDLVDAEPTEAELKAFVADAAPAKRANQIAQLVYDERFNQFWAKRFTKVFLGNLENEKLKLGDPVPPGAEAKAIQGFETWLRLMIQKDAPWTDIVEKMLTVRGNLSEEPAAAYVISFNRGQGLATEFPAGMARHLLGIRMHCASCHDHPFDKWRVEDYYGLSSFIISQRVRATPEISVKYMDSIDDAAIPVIRGGGDVKMAAGGTVRPAFLFGGVPEKNEDRMTALARFMTLKANTQLPRALANRVWGWLFGYGIVHPVDDYNLRNKALSPALAEILTRTLVDNKYSLKLLVRVICTSEAYQMPTPQEAPDAMSFRHQAQRKFGLWPHESFAGRSTGGLALSFMVPEPWIRVVPRGDGYGSKAFWRMPGKKEPTRFADLAYYETKKTWESLKSGGFVLGKRQASTLEGKLKLGLEEIAGSHLCRQGSDGPLETLALLVIAELPEGKAYGFKLEGPPDLVNEWRDEFLAMVKAATLK